MTSKNALPILLLPKMTSKTTNMQHIGGSLKRTMDPSIGECKSLLAPSKLNEEGAGQHEGQRLGALMFRIVGDASRQDNFLGLSNNMGQGSG